MQAICPKPGRQNNSQRMMDKPRRSERRDSTSSTSSSIFNSGLSPELSSSSLESESDFDFKSEPSSVFSLESPTLPWLLLLITHIPSASSSSRSSSPNQPNARSQPRASSRSRSRPTTFKLVFKPQSTSNNAKMNKAYDYIDGTSALSLSEEQIREGCESRYL